MSTVIQKSFNINLRIMQICRLYSLEKPTVNFKIQAYLIHISCVTLIPVLEILYLLLQTDLDMEKVNYNAGFLAQSACFVTKLLPFISNSHKIKNCIHYFEAQEFSCVRDNQTNIIRDCINVCKRNTFIFLMCVVGGVSSWATKPLFWKNLSLPVDVWLPFDFTQNFFVHFCVYICLATGVFFVALANGVIDPLIAGLAYHATCQIKILKDDLQHLDEYAEEHQHANNPESLFQHRRKNDVIYNNIQQCVDRHNAILSFVKEYEECFSPAMLSQIGASIFVICFTCLQLSKLKAFGYYAVQLAMYFSVILAQIYFYCYYGSELFEETNTLNNAIFMGKWYNYEMKSRKALIILMKKSQEPISITAGKILKLSLATFATVLKTSYSLLAVLKN